jgi:3-hydroxy-9,10-secoandrosta-1,3,5(10)-triene-9,17-dione monooxygenase
MTITVDPPDTLDAVLERVRELLPAIRERAAQTEQERSIPRESAQDFLDAGLARILTPKRYGGTELGLHAWIDTVVEIATADAAHGWCASLLIHHPHYVAQFPEAAQDAVWSDGPDVIMAAPFGPVMRAEPVAGGYSVSGEAAWASGVNHSTWIMVGSMLPGPGGAPDWTLFTIPPGSYTVRDTWDTVGMRGTGSNTVVLHEVFVPHDHTLRVADMREGTSPGGASQQAPFFRAPWVTYAPFTFVAPMLGAAQGALEDFRKWNADRVSLHGSAVAKYPSVQVKLARAAANLDAARLLIDRAMDVAEAAEPASLELRAQANRDAICASELIVGAMDTVMGMAGAAGYASSNRIQRAWRDVHFASSHVILNPEIGYAAWGRQQFGLDRDPEAQWF